MNTVSQSARALPRGGGLKFTLSSSVSLLSLSLSLSRSRSRSRSLSLSLSEPCIVGAGRANGRGGLGGHAHGPAKLLFSAFSKVNQVLRKTLVPYWAPCPGKRKVRLAEYPAKAESVIIHRAVRGARRAAGANRACIAGSPSIKRQRAMITPLFVIAPLRTRRADLFSEPMKVHSQIRLQNLLRKCSRGACSCRVPSRRCAAVPDARARARDERKSVFSSSSFFEITHTSSPGGTQCLQCRRARQTSSVVEQSRWRNEIHPTENEPKRGQLFNNLPSRLDFPPKR